MSKGVFVAKQWVIKGWAISSITQRCKQSQLYHMLQKANIKTQQTPIKALSKSMIIPQIGTNLPEKSNVSPNHSFKKMSPYQYYIDEQLMDKIIHQKIIPHVTTHFELSKRESKVVSSIQGERLAVKVITRIVKKSAIRNSGKYLFKIYKVHKLIKALTLVRQKINANNMNSAIDKLIDIWKGRKVKIGLEIVSRLVFKNQIISKTVGLYSIKMKPSKQYELTLLSYKFIIRIQQILFSVLFCEKLLSFNTIKGYSNSFKTQIQSFSDRNYFTDERSTIKRHKNYQAPFNSPKEFEAEKQAGQRISFSEKLRMLSTGEPIYSINRAKVRVPPLKLESICHRIRFTGIKPLPNDPHKEILYKNIERQHFDQTLVGRDLRAQSFKFGFFPKDI